MAFTRTWNTCFIEINMFPRRNNAELFASPSYLTSTKSSQSQTLVGFIIFDFHYTKYNSVLWSIVNLRFLVCKPSPIHATNFLW